VSGAGLRILAVDDEPRALADLERLLRAMPEVSGVECADAGAEALRRVAASSFDAVFLDVRIPGLDGLELARVLRRFAAAPELVFVSAHDDAAVEAFELRALDYLRKPVARARLTEAVHRVAHARAARSADGAAHPGHVEENGATNGSELDGGHDVVAVSALHGGATRLLDRGEIQYVSSYGDFVHVVTASSRYLLRSTCACTASSSPTSTARSSCGRRSAGPRSWRSPTGRPCRWRDDTPRNSRGG
jgi:DNA-binding LytR/AlgR family response regulator